MGRLIDTSNIRVKPQYMQDVMGIAMIRCEDLARILADVPTAEAIPKVDYENRLKADLKTILVELQLEIEDLYPEHQCSGELTGFADAIETITPIIQQKIDALKGEEK